MTGTLNLLRLTLCAVFLLAASTFAAGKVLDASQLDQAPVPLTQYFAVLEDPTLTLTLAEVQKPDVAARFKTDSPDSEGFNFSYSRSAYWLRLKLSNTTDQPVDRMLEIKFGRISSLQFHQPRAAGGYQTVETGNTLPFATRPYKNRFFVFPVTLPAHSDQVYYLRVQSVSSILVPARLWTPHAFYTYERTDYFAQAWYFGMVAAMIAFNSLLFVVLRSLSYLLYVSFVSCAALAMAGQNGLAKEYLWFDSPLWSEILPVVGYSLAAATFLLFMRRMLDTRIVFPKVDRLIGVFIVIHFLSPIGFVFSYQMLAKPVTLFYLATVMLVMGTALYGAAKRQRSAIVFLAVFSILFITATLNSLTGLGLLPANIVTNNLLQIGSASEMLLLALVLADRINVVRREKENAQQEALTAQQLLVENLRSSERMLEERVGQRTADLMESNAALSIANAELERLSVTDRLTGLYNRLMLDKVLEDELGRNQRYASEFALVLLDIDKFKSVNDTYGHPVGDLVLVEMAKLMTEVVRDVDVVGRWGGEEFLIICRDTGLDGAQAVAEKLRQAVAAHAFPVVGSKTSSFGVTAARQDDTVVSLLARVDSALYRAKNSGRNRVECEA